MVKQSEDKQLAQLLKKHRDFTQLESGKIRCQLTDHQVNNLKQLKEYIKGRSYKRALQSNFQIQDYGEYLKPYHNDPRYLFCSVTGAKVSNKKSVIEKHINGKRYKRVLQRLQEQKLKQLQRQKNRNSKQRKQNIAEEQIAQDIDQQNEEQEEIKPKKVAKKTKKISKEANKVNKSSIKTKKATTKSS